MRLDWSVTITIHKLTRFQPVIVYWQKKEIQNGNFESAVMVCNLHSEDVGSFLDGFEYCWKEKKLDR